MQTNDAFRPETLEEQSIEVYALEVCLSSSMVISLCALVACVSLEAVVAALGVFFAFFHGVARSVVLYGVKPFFGCMHVTANPLG